MKHVAASQDEKSRSAPETPRDERWDLVSRVVSEARAMSMSDSMKTGIAPRSVYGQNFANYAMNFSNYAMNFSNYAMNSGASAKGSVQGTEQAALPNGQSLPSIDQILERISGRARR